MHREQCSGADRGLMLSHLDSQLREASITNCDGLSEDGSHRLTYLNPWLPSWWNCLGKIRGVVLLEEACVWGYLPPTCR